MYLILTPLFSLVVLDNLIQSTNILTNSSAMSELNKSADTSLQPPSQETKDVEDKANVHAESLEVPASPRSVHGLKVCRQPLTIYSLAYINILTVDFGRGRYTFKYTDLCSRHNHHRRCYPCKAILT